jgi:RimJ/RimL family protein N-acetyltransferase
MNLWIRDATMADWKFLLDVKNDPETRRNSIVTHRKIGKKKHIEWLRGKIKSKKTLFFIIMDGTRERCGDVRFEIGEKETEVSVRIAKKYRGRGIGSFAVASLIKEVSEKQKKKFIAKIVDGNLPSLVIFLKNGFHFKRHENGIMYLERHPDG